MEYWIDGYGSTALSFEQPLAEEVVSLIRAANPGYMGVITLCKELATMGVPKPTGMRTFVNVIERETSLNVDEYWPTAAS